MWCKEYSNGTDVVWYFKNIDNKLIPDTRQLLQTYSNVPPEEVLPHINKIRDKAWKIRSHMCTGQGIFLIPSMPGHPQHSTILSRLKNGATLVDVGTFIGQDLRQLVVDGAPSNNMYAVDIVNHWDTGYEMYRDRDNFHAHYIECDILKPNPALKELNGKMDIIWITHVLHQWTWEGQVLAAKTLVDLSRVGTIVAGYQVGAIVAMFAPRTELMKGDSFLHDPESFARMWDEVGAETGSKWKTTGKLKTTDDMGWTPEDLPTKGRRILEFTAERVG
ncbi:methyltransferase domain-containing protein [Rutstroemia sp. NJR-2017a BBW]|nr:methyltransferase domain-containing protein [Rutstroemia sp. NJR-2017a BBW]